MRKVRKTSSPGEGDRRRRRSLVVLAVLAGLPWLSGPAPADAAEPSFDQRNFPFNSTKLFDLSVADIESDGDLDMFSVNHKFQGSLLANDGTGSFSGRLDLSGLGATPYLRNFGDLYRQPEMEARGLYVWVDEEGTTHVRTRGLRDMGAFPGGRVLGEISYFGRSIDDGTRPDVQILDSNHAKTSLRVDESTDPPSQAVAFDAGPNASIDIRARFMDLPFEVTIEPTYPVFKIFAGPDGTHPVHTSFEVDLGDRHAVAWGDYNADGITDAFITNGGVRGAVARFGDAAADELFFGNGDGTFTEDIASTGITKDDCRGRYAAPVDVEGDGDLDLFIGCEKDNPELFIQSSPGKFDSRNFELENLDIRGDLLRWVNVDESGPPELIAIQGRMVRVYKRLPEVGKFVQKQRVFSRGQGSIGDAIAPADFDRDGDIDIFIGSRGGNTMLVNRGGSRGKLNVARPERFGLPARGTIAANFIDYDNDGALDFHSVPHGLFERTAPQRYERTGEVRVGGRARFAIAQWFDYDNDGDRDLVSVLKRRSKILRKQIFENETESGNWLQVDLEGEAGNPQGLGSEVIVSTGGEGESGFVGQNEGSRFSTGHYRLYYGLGKAEAAEVTVIWPDGERTSGGFEANQRVTISRDDG
ncbi:MAG: CRTAC1 family protein [Solirubrobacterales bacterium]